MKYLWILMLAASPCVFAQDGGGNVVFSQAVGPISGEQIGGTVNVTSASGMAGAVIQGAPYSATITNQSIQTLGDGNRIVQTSTGTIARDSLGRTRRDVALPAIGGLLAANAPHLVFIQDPTTQTSYTLNLTDKTAQKLPVLSPMIGGPGAPGGPTVIQMGSVATSSGPLPPPPGGQAVFAQQFFTTNDQAQTSTEDLGSKTMEGILVYGVRTTRTIGAGQIGNDRPIDIVTEIWTSPDLKTIVYSKRSDPRMGDQTFQLTNVDRVEPDPSLFAVPADFKIIEGPQPILYRSKQ
jgi:hypothetical protein